MSRGLRPRVSEQLGLAALVATLVVLLAAGDWLWTWEQKIYDWQLRLLPRASPTDLVIVAVDERSLEALGQWPWPRSLHARLLHRLREAGARTVILDVIFSEPGLAPAAGDAALAAAAAAHGRVLLPVAHVVVNLGGQPLELLPYPELASAAAGLGHVEVPLDPDGLARSVYLRAGLGEAHWPHLALAALRLEDPDRWHELPGLANPQPGPTSPFLWQRDRQIWIPYLGPPGTVPRVSFVDLLNGLTPASELRGRLVLVGATAVGLGDALPTPVSGQSQPMPGVEIVANVYQGLRQRLEILPLGRPQRVLLSLLLALGPLLLYSRVNPRQVPALAAVAAVATLVLSVLLLHLGRLWFPPLAALVGIAGSYPLWSWRRLELLVRYLDEELERLHGEPKGPPGAGRPSLPAAMGFVAQVLPVRRAAMVADSGRELAVWEGVGAHRAAPGVAGALRIHDPGASCVLALEWRGEAPADTAERALLQELLKELAPLQVVPGRDSRELVQARIEQVREATAQVRTMRAFITNTLAQMADGVLVASVGGRVLVANDRAAQQVGFAAAAEVTGQALSQVLAGLELPASGSWAQAARQALVLGCGTQLEASDRQGREVLAQVSPFRADGQRATGLIVNLSDVSALRASERRRAELLGFISHDLRSPLVSILAVTQLMSLQGQVDERSRRIEAHARRTLNLADDLLALARMEGGEGIAAERLDLVAVAQAAQDQVRDEASARRTTLTPVLAGEPLPVQGDRGLLERMLVNLLGNAVKYSPEGAEVWLRLFAVTGRAVCEVRDQGYGIPEEDLPRLFDRFQRGSTEEHRRQRGAGLGLAFVKQVVEGHGGSIAVTSVVGAGSTFRVELPLL